MIQKKLFGFFAVFVSFIFLVSLVSAVNSQSTNYPAGSQNVPDNAHFKVLTLKYEPYPVKAGEWFDVWVKAENEGISDASHATFTIVNEYPFESDSARDSYDFGSVPGATSSYSYDRSQKIGVESNQVVMKFRVKAADSAMAGESNLKLSVRTNDAAPGEIYQLPIFIDKTKTDLDVAIQDANSNGVVLSVTNVGDADAKTVSLSVKSQEGLAILPGNLPSALGDLAQGEFTVARQKIIPEQGTREFNVMISYVDVSGIVTNVEKKVVLDENSSRKLLTLESDKPYIKWVFGIVGFLIGLFFVIFGALFKKKNRAHTK